MEIKRCIKCRKVKPITKFFDGYTRCKDCISEHQKRFRIKDFILKTPAKNRSDEEKDYLKDISNYPISMRMERRFVLKSSRNRQYKFIKKGYIYIIIHPLYPNWIKIGNTVNPEMRLKSYQTGDPTRSYRMYFKEEINNVNYIEDYFKINVISNGYEWFKIKKEKAKNIILKLIKEIESNQSKLFN